MALSAPEMANFRSALLALLEDAQNHGSAQSEATKPVELDQQSVGRLSRMDAMQHQAMAQATARRASQSEARLRAALARMDEGTYGECLDCGEDIPVRRLEVDPATPLCVSCLRG